MNSQLRSTDSSTRQASVRAFLHRPSDLLRISQCILGAFASVALVWGLPLRMSAADWPTYRHDNRRSGITIEPLQLPLELAWTYTSPTPPQTAWSGPAKWDSYANIRGLVLMRNFDPAFFVTAVGDSVYFGSSVDDAVHYLDAGNGR